MTTYVLSTEIARAGCAAVIARLPVEPVYQVVVGLYDPKRSGKQNRRFWKLMSLVEEHIPDEDGVLHSRTWWHLRKRHDFECFTDPLETITLAGGLEVPVVKSSADMKVKEFNDYMEQCEFWAAEHGILLDNWSG